jgi:hypothetical protein
MAIKRNAAGKIIPKKFAEARLQAASAANHGFCVACGAEKEACEPDARKYPCERCGMNLVFGAEEIAIMGWMR